MDKDLIHRIIIFAGTKEGRSLCGFLHNYKVEVTACVATEYGSLCLSDLQGITIRQGRLTLEEMKEIFPDYDYVVDATHPYAKLVSENIRMAATELGMPYLRVVRPSTEYDHVLECESLEEACEYLKKVSGTVLVTTGSKELQPYTEIPDYKNRLYVRVLPSLTSMEECVSHGFPSSHIICMQGPYTEELNVAMLRQVKAEYLITKDTGKNGGFDEKLSAALQCNVKVIVIGRPVQEKGLSLENTYHFLKDRLEPRITNGSHYPIFMNLRQRNITVIGAGNIALRRIKVLLEYDANITVVAPDIKDEIMSLKDRIHIIQKEYEVGDCKDAFIVLAATNHKELNYQIYEEAKRCMTLVNVADDKELSDFYLPAIFSDDNIIGGIISRNGENHSLVKEKAALIRSCLAKEGVMHEGNQSR